MEGGSVEGEVGLKKGCMGDVRVLSMVDMLIEWYEFVEACYLKSGGLVVSWSRRVL